MKSLEYSGKVPDTIDQNEIDFLQNMVHFRDQNEFKRAWF